MKFSTKMEHMMTVKRDKKKLCTLLREYIFLKYILSAKAWIFLNEISTFAFAKSAIFHLFKIKTS